MAGIEVLVGFGMEGMRIMRVESHTHISTHTERERERGTLCGTMIICVVLRSMKNKKIFYLGYLKSHFF